MSARSRKRLCSRSMTRRARWRSAITSVGEETKIEILRIGWSGMAGGIVPGADLTGGKAPAPLWPLWRPPIHPASDGFVDRGGALRFDWAALIPAAGSNQMNAPFWTAEKDKLLRRLKAKG